MPNGPLAEPHAIVVGVVAVSSPVPVSRLNIVMVAGVKFVTYTDFPSAVMCIPRAMALDTDAGVSAVSCPVDGFLLNWYTPTAAALQRYADSPSGDITQVCGDVLAVTVDGLSSVSNPVYTFFAAIIMQLANTMLLHAYLERSRYALRRTHKKIKDFVRLP